MDKKVNTNRQRVNIAAFLFIAATIVVTSCNYNGKRHTGYSYSSSYNCDDTLKSFDISLYARVSSRYNHNSLPIIIIISTPSGVRYSDTLQLPVTEKGVGTRKVQSGIWQDYEWSYRRNIVFSNKGKWIFTLKQDSLSLALTGVGQMGVKVSQSKNR